MGDFESGFDAVAAQRNYKKARGKIFSRFVGLGLGVGLVITGISIAILAPRSANTAPLTKQTSGPVLSDPENPSPPLTFADFMATTVPVTVTPEGMRDLSTVEAEPPRQDPGNQVATATQEPTLTNTPESTPTPTSTATPEPTATPTSTATVAPTETIVPTTAPTETATPESPWTGTSITIPGSNLEIPVTWVQDPNTDEVMSDFGPVILLNRSPYVGGLSKEQRLDPRNVLGVRVPSYPFVSIPGVKIQTITIKLSLFGTMRMELLINYIYKNKHWRTLKEDKVSSQHLECNPGQILVQRLH